jgi:uncharacterized MAPEG superfamily protein
MSDIVLLVIAVILGIVHLVIAAQAAERQRPPGWNVGPRDEPFVATGAAGRLERAYRNFMETFPLFAAAVLAVVVQSKSGVLSHIGVIVYVVARIAYVPLYAYAVTYVRSLMWFISMIGIVLVIIAALI